MNSNLVSYTGLSPHKGKRSHDISRITFHVFVGQVTCERGVRAFQGVAVKSCNYLIGTDGQIALVVNEDERSKCSSSSDNDSKAVTVECASDAVHPYAVNDKVYASMINLAEDICRRRGKKKLIYIDDKDKALKYVPAKDECILTLHKWFANKACPGAFVISRLPDIASEVTRRLSGGEESTAPDDNKILHTVKKGENLSLIARQYPQYVSSYKDIAKKNNILPPYIIKPGQSLIIR